MIFARVITTLMVLLLAPFSRGGAVLKDVPFAITNDVGFGYEACVLGPHPLLGGNDPLKAVKLIWSAGNIWRGTIALPAGESLAYRFVRRDFDASVWGDTNNLVEISAVMTARAPDHIAAPWDGKTIFLRSAWSQANILYRDLTLAGAWIESPMTRVDTDLFRIDGIAASGSEIEFVFNDGNGTWLNAPAPPSNSAQGSAPAVPAPYQGLSSPYNFRAWLDVFHVEGQELFNYAPAEGGLSDPRIEYRQVGSTVDGIPGRQIGIYLPRGYDENTWKRYPVIYFHDGQNVFFPGGSFGTWDADRIATYEISQGRMRETILVAIDNDGLNRLVEYLPDGETLVYTSNTYQGAASRYLQFILDNVTPTLDFNYRTLSDAENTMTAGSSMGGLISDYIGFQRSDRFGAAGIFSPAYWAAPVYLGSRTLDRLLLRRYLYMGTAESSAGESSSDIYWQGAVNTLNDYLNAGHPVHRELLFEGGSGALHNEPAWSRRLPSFFAFALDPWREANPLALEHFPPELKASLEGTNVQLSWTGLYGFKAEMHAASALQSPWITHATNLAPSVSEFWDEAVHSATNAPSSGMYWRLSVDTP